MPNEPNQSMEDQLRAYAERRRREAPAEFELDVVARRQLQAEVRRVHVEMPEPSGSRRPWFGWMRVGLAAAVAMMVLFISVRMMPREQPFLLTKSLDEPAAPAEITPDMAAFDRADASPDVTMPSEPAGIEPSMAEAKQEGVMRPASRAAQAPISAPMSAPSQGAGRELSFAAAPTTGEVVSLAGESVQDFLQVQRYRRNPNSPPPPQVLQTFRWLRNGDAIRVIDADGSVYTGEIVTVTPVRERRGIPSSAESTVLARDQAVQLRSVAGQTGERFAISGTNRTINARVEFEGFIVPQSIAGAAATAGGARPVGVGGVALQIQGQAVVGSSTRLEIVAVPRAE
jgi:hypothetical protein